LEKVFTGWAPFQAPLFTETSTLDTATLSLAVPSTMKLALLTVKPAGTLVMLKVGGVVSRRMIETDNGWGAVATRASVTCTVKLKVPLVVGVPESRLVLGKHSGRHALKKRTEDLGYDLSREELQSLYDRFTSLADNKKGLLDEEICELIEESRVAERPLVMTVAAD